MNLLERYCPVDDVVKMFLPEWNKQLMAGNKKQCNWLSRLLPSEMSTILIHFHPSHYRDFKTCYLLQVCGHLKSEFPGLLSDIRLLHSSLLFLRYGALIFRAKKRPQPA